MEGGPKLIRKIIDGDGDQMKGFSKIGEGFKEYLLGEKYDPLKLVPVIKVSEAESTSSDRKNLKNLKD